MTLVKKYLRDTARTMLIDPASAKQQERGKKLYGASKALEEMLDEIAVSYGRYDEGDEQ